MVRVRGVIYKPFANINIHEEHDFAFIGSPSSTTFEAASQTDACLDLKCSTRLQGVMRSSISRSFLFNLASCRWLVSSKTI